MLKIQGTYKILSNEKLCPRYYRLCFDAPSIVKVAHPGQFVHIRIGDGLEPFFRRPFSIHRAKKYIEIFYEVVGQGTRLLSSKQKGDMIDVVGPVGTPFSLPPKGIHQVVMVAGGIGVAPFLFFSDILSRKQACLFPAWEIVLLYGGRTRAHMFNMKEFKANGCKVFVVTDNGSIGVKGRVSKLFDKIDPNPASTFIYTCGPGPMMASVQAFARKHQLRGEASLEEIMACGTGVCLGCSMKTTRGFKTVCGDGPVFDLEEIMFKKLYGLPLTTRNFR